MKVVLERAQMIFIGVYTPNRASAGFVQHVLSLL